jgi:pimeloyl-ACP methyl ester carboxylesterase
LSEKTLATSRFKCRALVYYAPGVPVVFLHGYSYNSTVWERLSVTELLRQKRVPFVALDMPYGPKSECQPKTRDEEASVELAREATQQVFKTETPVLVGASFGGHLGLKYAAQFPVKGLLLVAPARPLGDEKLVEAYRNFKFPVRLIWGSEDNIVSGEEMRTLSEKLPAAKLVTYEGAGHSAYVSHTDRFKRDLMELYASAEQT